MNTVCVVRLWVQKKAQSVDFQRLSFLFFLFPPHLHQTFSCFSLFRCILCIPCVVSCLHIFNTRSFNSLIFPLKWHLCLLMPFYLLKKIQFLFVWIKHGSLVINATFNQIECYFKKKYYLWPVNLKKIQWKELQFYLPYAWYSQD